RLEDRSTHFTLRRFTLPGNLSNWFPLRFSHSRALICQMASGSQFTPVLLIDKRLSPGNVAIASGTVCNCGPAIYKLSRAVNSPTHAGNSRKFDGCAYWCKTLS